MTTFQDILYAFFKTHVLSTGENPNPTEVAESIKNFLSDYTNCRFSADDKLQLDDDLANYTSNYDDEERPDNETDEAWLTLCASIKKFLKFLVRLDTELNFDVTMAFLFVKTYHDNLFPIQCVNRVFMTCCDTGNLKLVQYLVENYPTLDIHYEEEAGFDLACENNHLSVAQYLESVTGHGDNAIDVTVNFGQIFSETCASGYLEMAQWLVQAYPNIDIRVNHDAAFMWSAMNDQRDVCHWLASLNGIYLVEIENDVAYYTIIDGDLKRYVPTQRDPNTTVVAHALRESVDLEKKAHVEAGGKIHKYTLPAEFSEKYTPEYADAHGIKYTVEDSADGKKITYQITPDIDIVRVEVDIVPVEKNL